MKYIERVAYILLLIAAVLAFSHIEIARYLASVGAAGIAVTRLKEQYIGTNLRLKRLIRLRHMVGIGYVIGAGLMFKEHNYWLVAFAVSVMIEIYTIFVFDRESKKENVSENKNITKK